MDGLVFLKLGGSLITDKTRRYTPRLDKIGELADALAAAVSEFPNLRLILGHGSGSFGHFAVHEHLAREMAARSGTGRPPAQSRYWQGYAEVLYRASQLNRHVMDALHQARIPAISLPPSAAVLTAGGAIVNWDLEPLKAALESGVLPVIFGDIVLDSAVGATVLSTESLMLYLAPRMQPKRILLAGLEAAVWADFPVRKVPLQIITPAKFASVARKIGGSAGPDVTGGMLAKVRHMLDLVKEVPGLSVQVFSGEDPATLRAALAGGGPGTVIASD